MREKFAHLERELRELRRQMRTSDAIVPQGDLPLVCLWVDGQKYALYVPVVREVIRMMALSPLPGAPQSVLGLARVRRDIVPVIDLRRVLHLEPRPFTANTPLILFEHGSQLRGLIVDAVDEVITVPPTAIELPQDDVPHGDYLLRIVRQTDGLIMVLDHGCLLPVEDEVLLVTAMSDARHQGAGSR